MKLSLQPKHLYDRPEDNYQGLVSFRNVTRTACWDLLYFLLSIFWTGQSKGERHRQAIQPLLKHQPMKYRTLNQGQTTTPATPCPIFFDKCVGSLTSPPNHVILKMQETGPTVYSPYLRRLKHLTIFRCHYKGSTFSSVI